MSTYDAVKAVLGPRPVSLVIVDPPFGVHKAGKKQGWDDKAWTPEGQSFLTAMAGLEFTRTYTVGIYSRRQDLQKWEDALEKGVTGLEECKGSFWMTLGRDEVAHLQKGTPSNGKQLHMLVMKFGHGARVSLDPNTPLGGRFAFNFPSPTRSSKYGRYEVDGLLTEGGVAVNATQKPIEEARLMVRALRPDGCGGAVLSLCNGTGTTMIAAALEGMDAVGVDDNKQQCTWARRRLRCFFQREGFLYGALQEGRSATSPEFKALQKAAGLTGVPELEVRIASGNAWNCDAQIQRWHTQRVGDPRIRRR